MDAKFYRLIAFLIVHSIVFERTAAFEIHNQCKLDSDCGRGAFCHYSLCERCIPCEQLFNRFSPVKKACAKVEDDCGSCLNGYQAEDLTSQRRSMKCFATGVSPGYIEKPTTFLAPSNLLYGGLGLVIIIILGSLIVAGFIMWMSIKGQSSSCNQVAQDGDGAQQKDDFEGGRLPPPYETSSHRVGLPRTSHYSYTRGLPEQDILNHAAPFDPYHNRREFDASSLDFDVDLHAVDDVLTAQDDQSGSTETIPSHWEPSTINEMPTEDAEEPTEHSSQRNSLVRSYSFESPAQVNGINQLPHESRSDPALDGRASRTPSGGQRYAHRHIHLSRHRPEPPATALPDSNGANATGRNSNLGAQVENQRLPCQIEDLEPIAPQAFIFDDSLSNAERTGGRMQNNDFFTRSLQHFLTQTSYNMSQMGNSGESERGSQDSGFFDESRRRPATEELELGMAIYVKRSRQVD